MECTEIVNMFNNGEITNEEMWKMIQEKLGEAKQGSYIYPVNELIKNKGYVKEF